MCCTLVEPAPEGQRFALPAWIPGSYLVRDFARHVVDIRAVSGRKALSLRKIDKHTWQCAPSRTPVTVTMQVYAFDPSVRGAYLDTHRGFFNGPCLFLKPLGREHLRCSLDILAPSASRFRDWQVATSLARSDAVPFGFGGYCASDYDDLIDHPVELGNFTVARFRACGVAHDIVISGRHNTDLPRLTRDLKSLCESQIKFFAGRSQEAPFDRYVFLINAQGEGYGGLEHRASTALLCGRHELPQAGASQIGDDYRTFLALASHEYFHAWNVKRIRPNAFTPYVLDRENHTELLWVFEGITAYYEDLFLVRCGLISQQAYLETLAKDITNLLRTPGRARQTLAEASWDAWIKYYRQDEDSPNSQVSYYLKGSLAALCLDLLIRHRTHRRKSLDHVMRALWNRHGKTQIGLEEDGFEALTEEVTGLRLGGFFDAVLRTTRDLPLPSVLKFVGVSLQLHPPDSIQGPESRSSDGRQPFAGGRADLGIRTAEDSAGVRLAQVLDRGAAQRAGLCPGDLVIAIDALRVTGKNFERIVRRLRPGRSAQIHVFRGDELLAANIMPDPARADTCRLLAPPAPLPASYKSWLGL